MVGDKTDKQIRDYINYLQSTGAVVNTSVVIANAKEILMYKDANLLSIINLTKVWAKYLLNRMGYVKEGLQVKLKLPLKIDELKKDYLVEIKLVVEMDEIPADLIIKFSAQLLPPNILSTPELACVYLTGPQIGH